MLAPAAPRRSQRGEEDLSWCFNDKSENSHILRNFDFSKTSIGPIESWPMALKVTLSVCLNSRFPMILWLGRDLQIIYNDAYNQWLGPKHPRALCNPGRECWPEIWDIIGVALRSVLDTGEATWSDDQLLLVNRYGETEESYWTYSYSPIRDQDGTVVGAFTAVEETTGRYVGERRLRTLQELSASTAIAPTSAAVADSCAEVFKRNAHDVPFMGLYTLNGDDMCLASSVGLDTSLMPRLVKLSSAATSALPDIFSVPLRGVVSLQQGFSRIEVAVPAAYPLNLAPDIARPKKAVIMPLLSIQPTEAGSTTTTSSVLGAIIIGINARKPVDDQYNTFLSLLASGITAALVTARDYEREKQRAEALVELNNAKTTFFHNISHEFRTPLTLMLGPLEEVLERAVGLAEDQRESLERVLRNGNRLLKLVNVLLDFSRIEAGRMRATFRPVDLPTFTADLCSLFRSACERARLELIVDTPPLQERVYVDVDMWEQIVVNLIGNAFKYTLRGSIAARLYEQGNKVIFTVTDTGCGIAPDHLGRVFERFYRIHGTQGRTDEGSGIGLALLAELVKLHSGEVFVESELGKGSTFRVVLQKGRAHLPDDQVREEPAPVKQMKKGMLDWWIQLPPTEAARTHATKRSKRANSPQQALARILVADDNADMLTYVSRMVKDAGYDVVTAPNGEVALELLCTSSPPIDLLVSDIMMPRLDGKELVRAVRMHDQIKNTPVILVSARAGEEERTDGISAGADDYLVKPFSAKELLSRIAARLELARERSKTAQREQELREAAERANATKDHFLAVLSHELRTPLTPVLMLAEAAESDLNLPPSVRADMALIAQNVRLEVELLSDLLDITRIRQKKLILRHERLDLRVHLRRTLELFRHQLLEKKIALHFNTDAPNHTVVGDPTRLQQVFWNLIGNAVKFTPQGGELTVSTEPDGDRVRVKVQDSGIGIEPAALPRIFDAFEQGISGVRFGGIGLGLSIAKTLVGMHNGTITAFSAGRDRGALFVVSLPLETNSAQPGTTAKPSPTVQDYSRPTTFPGLRVLIVEDNRTSLLVLARILERLGCKVVTATSVAEARTALATTNAEFDVLVSDIGLPDGSGHDVVKFAQISQSSLRGAIALSGFGNEEDVQKSVNAGFVRHLTKPVRLRELQEAIEELPIKDIIQY